MVDPLAPADPERIDEYTLEGRLGAGGYGVVYSATDPDEVPVWSEPSDVPTHGIDRTDGYVLDNITETA